MPQIFSWWFHILGHTFQKRDTFNKFWNWLLSQYSFAIAIEYVLSSSKPNYLTWRHSLVHWYLGIRWRDLLKMFVRLHRNNSKSVLELGVSCINLCCRPRPSYHSTMVNMYQRLEGKGCRYKQWLLLMSLVLIKLEGLISRESFNLVAFSYYTDKQIMAFYRSYQSRVVLICWWLTSKDFEYNVMSSKGA